MYLSLCCLVLIPTLTINCHPGASPARHCINKYSVLQRDGQLDVLSPKHLMMEVKDPTLFEKKFHLVQVTWPNSESLISYAGILHQQHRHTSVMMQRAGQIQIKSCLNVLLLEEPSFFWSFISYTLVSGMWLFTSGKCMLFTEVFIFISYCCMDLKGWGRGFFISNGKFL